MIRTSLESSESFLCFYTFFFCKHQAWTGTFWKTHFHTHIATQPNTYAWPISHSCMPSWLNLPTPSTNYTHLRHTRILGLSRSHSPFRTFLHIHGSACASCTQADLYPGSTCKPTHTDTHTHSFIQLLWACAHGPTCTHIFEHTSRLLHT